ncbi:MAG: hypothetical protein HKL96_03460, partial [Phycisphaerales bacterium]|nr:hypothetical protein [Phycisphaerales bacterium]
MSSLIDRNPHAMPRRELLLAAVAAALSGGGLRAAASAGAAVHIDPHVSYPVFEGWGVSLAWWAHVVGGLRREVSHKLVQKVFDPAIGLGFNIARYNIGGGENPKYHFMQSRAAIPGFMPRPQQWDW